MVINNYLMKGIVMSDNQTYRVKVIKNMLRDIYYNIQYIGNQPLEVGGDSLYKEKASFI